MNIQHKIALTVTAFALTLSLMGCNNNATPKAGSENPTPKPTGDAPKDKTNTTTTAPNTEKETNTTSLAGFVPSPKEFYQTSKPVKMVSITFDAGSFGDGTLPILEVLKKHNVRSTFFLTGEFCRHFPKEAKAIADASMEIGNHSFSHPHFPKLSKEKILEELDKADEIIQKTTGITHSVKPIFRFPYGDRDARTEKIVADAGYQSFYWAVDVLDSVGHRKTSDFMADRLIHRLKDGGISLAHVSYPETAISIDKALDHLEKEGIKSVPVSELILKQRENEQAKDSSKPVPTVGQ